MSHRESAPAAGAVLLAAPPDRTDDALLWSPIAGRPLVAWPLAALRAAPAIGPLALLVPQARLGAAAKLIAAEGYADTRAHALPAGVPLAAAIDLTSRAPLPAGEEEARSAGDEVQPPVIVLHDAARPLVTAAHIQAIVAAAAETGVAVGAEPVKETIKCVAAGRVVETLSRDELALLIPPLAVRADVLSALLAAPEHPPLARIIDYVAAALAHGVAVRTVAVSGPSLAVVSREDVAVAEALLSGGALQG